MTTCFECGGKIDTTEPCRYMEVYHEKNNPEKMPVYAHERCIIGSPNELNWRRGVRVDPGKGEQKGDE